MFIELPRYYQATGYADDLSFNAQLYVQCSRCLFEERACPAHLAMVARERLEQSECPNCQQKRRVIFRHREHVTLACGDCHRTTRVEVAPWVQVRCPHCLSTRYEQSDSAIEPPLPPVFGELGERLTMFLGAHENKKHPWGVDGVEDSTRIIAELSAVDDEPDFYRHILMGAMFARSLIMGKNYSTEIDYNMMLTALGNLERQYFDATGELAVGLDAVGVFEDAARVAPDAANLASSEHNVAMAINSLLIKYPDDGLAQATGRAHLRNDALEAASRALAGYGAIPAGTMFPVAGAALTATQQAGRIHHLMGDLLAHAQMDDDRLRVAIAHYDAALDAGLPDAILRGVRESRAGALSNLSAPTQEELEAAAAELQYLTS